MQKTLQVNTQEVATASPTSQFQYPISNTTFNNGGTATTAEKNGSGARRETEAERNGGGEERGAAERRSASGGQETRRSANRAQAESGRAHRRQNREAKTPEAEGAKGREARERPEAEGMAQRQKAPETETSGETPETEGARDGEAENRGPKEGQRQSARDRAAKGKRGERATGRTHNGRVLAACTAGRREAAGDNLSVLHLNEAERRTHQANARQRATRGRYWCGS